MQEYVEKMLYAKVESKAIDASGIPLYLRGLYSLEQWAIFGQEGKRPGRRREEREEAPQRRMPPRHVARRRRTPRHEQGHPR